MKAKELIYNLRATFAETSSQLKSKTDQHVMYMLDSARSVLATQKLNRSISLNQMAQFLDVTPTKANGADDLGVVGEASVIKVAIPKPVSYDQGEAIFTVGAKDGQDSFSRISFSELRTVFYRKYTSSTPKWLWHNEAIYIVNTEIDSLRKVRVRGIFEEPYKVEIAMGRYKYLEPFDWEYPATFRDSKVIYQLAMAAELGWGDVAIQAILNAERKQRKDQELIGALKGKTSNAEVQ